MAAEGNLTLLIAPLEPTSRNTRQFFQQVPDLSHGQAGDKQQLLCLHSSQSQSTKHINKVISPAGSNTHTALMPCSHSQLLITEPSWLSALGQSQNFVEMCSSSRGTGGAGLPGSSSLHTPPSGSPPQDTQPPFLPQALHRQQPSAGFSSKIQPCLQTLSLLLPKAEPPFVLLPPAAGSAPLSQMNSPQYSSQAVLSSLLPQHKEQRHRAQKGAFLSPSTQLWEKPLTGQVWLPQSLQLSWMFVPSFSTGTAQH